MHIHANTEGALNVLHVNVSLWFSQFSADIIRALLLTGLFLDAFVPLLAQLLAYLKNVSLAPTPQDLHSLCC